MKKSLFILTILLTLNLSIFAKPIYNLGLDLNLNDVGLSLTQTIDKFNIKATLGYPLFAILQSQDDFNNASIEDFLETLSLHGTINYNLISFKNFFLNLGFGSDVFMQFDFSNEHSHYTCFSVGPYGEIGYSIKNNNREKYKLSFAMNLPLLIMENKPTSIEEPIEESWNELINYNYSIFNMILMVYKFNITIPL